MLEEALGVGIHLDLMPDFPEQQRQRIAHSRIVLDDMDSHRLIPAALAAPENDPEWIADRRL